MEEKRQELRSEKQRKLIEQLVNELSQLDPNFYYQSTSEIAHILRDYIQEDAKLDQVDRALLVPLSARDIQILLSIH